LVFSDLNRRWKFRRRSLLPETSGFCFWQTVKAGTTHFAVRQVRSPSAGKVLKQRFCPFSGCFTLLTQVLAVFIQETTRLGMVMTRLGMIETRPA